MKRKTYIKRLMAHGITRNHANQCAARVRELEESYNYAYDREREKQGLVLFGILTPDASADICTVMFHGKARKLSRRLHLFGNKPLETKLLQAEHDRWSALVRADFLMYEE